MAKMKPLFFKPRTGTWKTHLNDHTEEVLELTSKGDESTVKYYIRVKDIKKIDIETSWFDGKSVEVMTVKGGH